MSATNAYRSLLAKIQKKQYDDQLASNNELIELVYLNACAMLEEPLSPGDRTTFMLQRDEAKRLLGR